MITITGTLFDILGLLSLIIIWITVLFTWKEHNTELCNIEREKRYSEEKQYHWFKRMGLEETGLYFNRYGLDTVTRWHLWGHSIWS